MYFFCSVAIFTSLPLALLRALKMKSVRELMHTDSGAKRSNNGKQAYAMARCNVAGDGTGLRCTESTVTMMTSPSC
jgi:hypothetical protein